MKTRHLILAGLTASSVFGGCASTATRLPTISEPALRAEPILQENKALAARAGLEQGDFILINGKPAGTRDGLRNTLQVDQVEPTIRRDAQELTLTAQPEVVCRLRLRLLSSAAINANGRNITVTTGMMEFTKSDDELAMIIDHELVHNMMGHICKVGGNLILSGFATRYIRPFELESDYVELYYMVRAGFDPDGVEAFWRRLADIDPCSVNHAKTHPTFSDQYLPIAAARDEIRAK